MKSASVTAKWSVVQQTISHKRRSIMISGSSIFGQVLSLVDRKEFNRIVRKHKGDYGSKGFRCQDLLGAMLFCQIGQASSLSEISCGLDGAGKSLRHLGMAKAPVPSRRFPMPMLTGPGRSSRSSSTHCTIV